MVRHNYIARRDAVPTILILLGYVVWCIAVLLVAVPLPISNRTANLYTIPVYLSSLALLYRLWQPLSQQARRGSLLLLVSNSLFIGTAWLINPATLEHQPFFIAFCALWYVLDLCYLMLFIPVRQIPLSVLLRNAANVLVIMSVIEVVFNIIFPYLFPFWGESLMGRLVQFRLDTTIAVVWGYIALGRHLRGFSSAAQGSLVISLFTLIVIDALMLYGTMTAPALELMNPYSNPYLWQPLWGLCIGFVLVQPGQGPITWAGPPALTQSDTLRQSLIRSATIIALLFGLIILTPSQGHNIWFVIALMIREALSRYERELFTRQQQTMQATLFEKNNALQQANEEIQRLLTSRMRLVDHAAHDLGHALVTQQSALDYAMYELEQGGIALDVLLPHQQAMEGGIVNQKRILDELRELGRMEKGIAIEIHYQDAPLGSLVHQLIKRFEPQFFQHGVRIYYCEHMRGTIRCDPDRLIRVIQNLVTNALYATPEGGEVTLTLTETETHVELRVTDTGVGMSITQLHLLQASHYQVGAGVGLQFCDGIIRQHNGTLTIQSVEGQGTIVTVALPR